MRTYPASRVSFDLPDFSSKVKGDSACRVKRTLHIAEISVASPIVINMPTRELLAGETKISFA